MLLLLLPPPLLLLLRCSGGAAQLRGEMNSVGLIASIAQEQWRNRQYMDCLGSLEKLQEQLSTEEGAAAAGDSAALAESKLRHNQALTRFAAGG